MVTHGLSATAEFLAVIFGKSNIWLMLYSYMSLTLIWYMFGVRSNVTLKLITGRSPLPSEWLKWRHCCYFHIGSGVSESHGSEIDPTPLTWHIALATVYALIVLHCDPVDPFFLANSTLRLNKAESFGRYRFVTRRNIFPRISLQRLLVLAACGGPNSCGTNDRVRFRSFRRVSWERVGVLGDVT